MDDLRVRQSLDHSLFPRRLSERQGDSTLAPSEGEHQRGEVGARIIFALLSGHRLLAACDEAVRQGNLRLATLLAQVGGDPGCREEVKGQVDAWKEVRGSQGERWAWIGGVDRQRLWSLLSGNVGVYTSLDRETGSLEKKAWVGEGLDWKRLFGLHLWFSGKEDEGIEEVVAQYDRMMLQVPSGLSHAVPWYQQGEVADGRNEGTRDVLYHLLRLYCQRDTYPLGELLEPRSYGPSPLDYRLGWQLSLLLESLGYWQGESRSRQVRLTENLAWELECLDLWEWAIYVLSWLENKSSRERAIKELLARHSDELGQASPKEIFLKERLQIPMVWAWEAKAIQARWEGDIEGEIDWLIRAGKWKEAHDKLIHDLAAGWILEGRLGKLKAQLEAIRVGLHVGNRTIPLGEEDDTMGEEGKETKSFWQTGGCIFLEFITLTESFPMIHRVWKASGDIPTPQGPVEGPVKEFIIRMRALLVVLGKMAERTGGRGGWQSDIPTMGFIAGFYVHKEGEEGPGEEDEGDLAWQVCLANMARQLTKMMSELGMKEVSV
ncbi:MAG: nuclear protein 96-domain-containing protein [Piptocephalis tieghemiana]|nr:MAG: nuclear protein 96-domain-containing protein [Piptocephalis tieghemiana]